MRLLGFTVHVETESAWLTEAQAQARWLANKLGEDLGWDDELARAAMDHAVYLNAYDPKAIAKAMA